MPDDPSFTEHPEHATWKRRMAELEASGLTTSDAQGVCDIEWLRGKFNTTKTSAPKHIACPTCGRTNQDNAIACWRCSTPIAKHRTSPPIMDEEDARADLKNQCAELRARNAALEAALRNCLIPLQDAQNQLHHTRAAAAYLDAKLLLRES